MYSTIQAWNMDESFMILYDQTVGMHQLLNGQTYEFIRYLNDINPDDLEQLFWSHIDPAILYYLESGTDNFIIYNINTSEQTIIVNLDEITANCMGNISLGNDVQMMSWDSDIISFRCNNERAYYYRISSEELTEINVSNVDYTAPMPGPSGSYFYHNQNIYNQDGNLLYELNERSTEHSCLGKLSNGNDGHFAIAFAEGPNGGCIGDIIGHDMTTGNCFPIISQSQGYNYPQSGTHISAVSYANTEGGWLAASMIGYDQDGASLLDQELVIAKANPNGVLVCRIGHHRSDEDEFDYWGEPHATISPRGTRVLFGSDWSGDQDGHSVDSYVVELPSYEISTSVPVILFDFSVTTQNSNVIIFWQTTSETNNEAFEIERSNDGIDWNTIGRRDAIGNSSVLQSYTFLDRKPLIGESYYRLKQIDYNGDISHSIIETISFYRHKIDVYPNPARQTIYIQTKSDLASNLLLYNVLGKSYSTDKILKKTNNQTYSLDISNLDKGLYFIRSGNSEISFSVY